MYARMLLFIVFTLPGNKVKYVLKDHPIGHKNVVCQDRWSLVTGSVILKCRSLCQKCVVCQGRWSLMAVVSQDRFHYSHFVEMTESTRENVSPSGE